MRTKKKIDDMMSTIVSIQNMLLDYSTAAQIHTSWMVQLDWLKVDVNNHNGNTSLSELLEKLIVDEQEDVDEEDDSIWIRPLVKRKKALKKGSSTVCVFTDQFHDPGQDFSSIGLRGLGPSKFGSGDEKHYSMFYKMREKTLLAYLIFSQSNSKPRLIVAGYLRMKERPQTFQNQILIF